jgi:copper chaperone
MKEVKLTIEGMSCGHCVRAVNEALAKVPGVTVDEVAIGTARVRLDESRATTDDVERAVSAAGYEASARSTGEQPN